MSPLNIDPCDFDIFRSESAELERFGGMPALEGAVKTILETIGEDLSRPGLERTPQRVACMYRELTAGYHVDPERLINNAIFEVDYDEMVVVRDIDYYSLCEHHMLPFMGKCHVGYVPDGKVIGLSKIPRIVEMFARRLQIQEQMTQQIAEFLDETLHPLGVAVVVEGVHLCAAMRGIKKANARMVTSAMLGIYKKHQSTRAEFLSIIHQHS